MAMSLRNSAALLCAALALVACGHKAAADAPKPIPSGLLLDDKGVIMPLDKAIAQISFRPIVPSTDPIAIAVIPPLGNADTQDTRGIAFEYDAGGDTMVLSEWPGQTFRIVFGKHDASEKPCVPMIYSNNGVVWTTPSGLVMTLQPDGDTARAKVIREARALIARGACK